MRSKRQLRYITVLMVLSLALIGLFLGIWIDSSYETEKRNLNKALNVLYNELTQEQFTEYITGELSRYVLQQQLASGMLSLNQISALKSSATVQSLGTPHLVAPQMNDTTASHHKRQPESLQEQVPTIQSYNSIDDAPDSIKKLLVNQIQSIASTPDGLTIIAQPDSAISSKDTPAKVSARGTAGTLNSNAKKSANLDEMIEQVMGMINGANVIKSMDTARLFSSFSSMVVERYKGLKVSKKQRYNDDFLMDNEKSVASLLGMEVYVYNYRPYLWTGLYTQLMLSLVVFVICTLTFYFSYRTLVQQQQLTTQKNDFISNTAHELKTPITTSLLALEAFNHFEIKDHIEQTKEYISIANSELKRLEAFVLNILNQLSVDQGTIQFHKSEFRFPQLLQNVITKYKATIIMQERVLEILGTVPNGVIEGDPFHLESAIGNVLDNAIKYGREKVCIATHAADGYVSIEIEDDGTGIAPKESKRVFEKFYRVHSEKGHIVKGHGLGLAYTQYVIKAHNGTIRIDDSTLGGAKFIIKIPIKY
ncbi:sensor histidine kinase [Edaphocola aurantiacus]|uniref:sensor histidine kinase n=1 Tax=Edaphocola aurantiacus TaxID=2601682 RepID=UPI001C96CFC7|nr:HAMP domain-containing sensor histidine kinase [Edaphocola aurantiacus]